jgi:hypothetical protein
MNNTFSNKRTLSLFIFIVSFFVFFLNNQALAGDWSSCNPQCGDGEACVFEGARWQCVQGASCLSNSGCAAGYICLNGRCTNSDNPKASNSISQTTSPSPTSPNSQDNDWSGLCPEGVEPSLAWKNIPIEEVRKQYGDVIFQNIKRMACSMPPTQITALDPWTGEIHFEYKLLYPTGNQNIWVYDPSTNSVSWSGPLPAPLSATEALNRIKKYISSSLQYSTSTSGSGSTRPPISSGNLNTGVGIGSNNRQFFSSTNTDSYQGPIVLGFENPNRILNPNILNNSNNNLSNNQINTSSNQINTQPPNFSIFNNVISQLNSILSQISNLPTSTQNLIISGIEQVISLIRQVLSNIINTTTTLPTTTTSTSTSISTPVISSNKSVKGDFSSQMRYIKDDISISGWVAFREMEFYDENNQKIIPVNATASCDWCKYGAPA